MPTITDKRKHDLMPMLDFRMPNGRDMDAADIYRIFQKVCPELPKKGCKWPADFSGSMYFGNQEVVVAKKTRKRMEMRVFTWCPYCNRAMNPGKLRQHLQAMIQRERAAEEGKLHLLRRPGETNRAWRLRIGATKL